MTVQEIFKLLDAGFTAAEIRAMDPDEPKDDPKPDAPKGDPKPKDDPKPDAPKDDPKPEKKEEPAPAPDPLDSIKQQIQGLTDVVDKMSKALIMPNLDDVNPLGVDDIITNFFKED